MKCYQLEVYFTCEIEDKNEEEFKKVITLSLARGTAFLVTIAGVNCNTLIDTSATRSCISETFYNQLMLPWLVKAFHLPVTSASGSTLCPMGIVQYPFELGGHSFEFNSIVFQDSPRPIILGLDFMHKHQTRLSWSNARKRLLTLENKVLAEAVNICETGPQLMTYSSLPLPSRMLAVINIHVDLKETSTEHTYEVKQNSLLVDQYANMVIIHVIYIMPVQTDTIILFIIINLSTESIFLSKCEVLGFLDQIDTEIW